MKWCPLILLLAFALLAPTAFVHADLLPACSVYGNIVNINDTGQTTEIAVRACGLCDFWHLANNVVNFFLFTVSVPLLTIILLYGGTMMVISGGDPGSISQGKKAMTNAIIGLLIAFSGWAVVNTIITTLATGQISAAWSKIPECVAPIVPPPTALPLPVIPDDATVANPNASPEGTASHEAMQQLLDHDGIPVLSTGNCHDKTQSTCTSLDGIHPEVVAEVLTLKLNCHCDVKVTGGTEVGHAGGAVSHGTGYKIDVQANSSVDSFIQSTPDYLTRTGSRGDTNGHGGPMYTKTNNQKINYVRELNPAHWDITVNP